MGLKDESAWPLSPSLAEQKLQITRKVVEEKRVGVKHSKILYAITTTLPLSQTRPSRIKRPQEQIPSSSMPAKGNACNHF